MRSLTVPLAVESHTTKTKEGPTMPSFARALVVAVTLSLAFASSARAGITDPPPAGFQHIYSVPGVVNNANAGAAFICTALEPLSVGIEVFDNAGVLQSPAVGTGVALATGATATFVTQSLPNVVSTHNLSIGTTFQGSARIVASSKKLICTAYNADTAASYLSQLPIVAKLKQHGD
jgi:hypothetical protein